MSATEGGARCAPPPCEIRSAHARRRASQNAPASPRDLERQPGSGAAETKKLVNTRLTTADLYCTDEVLVDPDLYCTDEVFVDGASVAIPSQETAHRAAKKPRVEPRASTQVVDQSASQVTAPDSPPRRKRGRPPKNPPRDPNASKLKKKVVRQLDFDGVASPRTECDDENDRGTPLLEDTTWSIGLDRDYISRMNKYIGPSRMLAAAPEPLASCETQHGFGDALSRLPLQPVHRRRRPIRGTAAYTTRHRQFCVSTRRVSCVRERGSGRTHREDASVCVCVCLCVCVIERVCAHV